MLRFSILFLFLLIFLRNENTAIAQNLPSFKELNIPDDLKFCDAGKIEYVSYYFFEVKNDTVPLIPARSEEYIFKDGIIVVQKVFDPYTGNVKIARKYDLLGRIISESYFAKEAFHPGAQYVYDESKFMCTEKIFRSDSAILRQRIKTYDQKNKILKDAVFDNKNILTYYYEYQYNRHGDLVKSCFRNTTNGPGVTLDESFTGRKTEFTPNPNDSTLYKYKYGWHHKLKIKSQFNNKNQLEKKTQYSSKKDTIITKELHYWPGKITPLKRIINKKIGNKTIEFREFLDDNQNVSSRYEYIYLNGEIIESKSNRTKPERYIYRYKYEFDNHGNWIVKFRYDNDKLWSVTKREIKYK